MQLPIQVGDRLQRKDTRSSNVDVHKLQGSRMQVVTIDAGYAGLLIEVGNRFYNPGDQPALSVDEITTEHFEVIAT